MRRSTKMEIIFGILALALIYLVLANDASITGFVADSDSGLTLFAPADSTETRATSITFIFKYSPEVEMKECSLILDDTIARTISGILSPYNSRIKKDIVPGTYAWRIECTDAEDATYASEIRLLRILEEVEEGELRKIPKSGGYAYEFELRAGLELEINEVVQNDAFRIKENDNVYEMQLVKIIQDYSLGLMFSEFLVTPGNKWVKVYEGDSAMVDFNNDGLDDLEVMLTDVAYRKANFMVSTKNIEKAVEAEEPEPSDVTGLPQEEAEKEKIFDKKAGSLVGIFVIGAIIILIIAAVLLYKNKLEEEKAYVSKLKKGAKKKLRKIGKKIKKRPKKKKTKKKAKKKKKK